MMFSGFERADSVAGIRDFGKAPTLRERLRGKGFVVASALLALVAATSSSMAATTTISTLIDTDNNASSGCTISTANGPFAGVERVLNTTVVADSTGYRVQSITLQNCVGSSLGPAAVIDNTPTPLARGNGSNGTTAVETYVPNVYLPATGQKMRVGILTTGADGVTGADALTAAANGPILVDGPPLVVVPTLATFSLALTALLLAGSLWFARRRGWHGLQLVVVAAFAISMSSQLIAAIVRDGLTADWTGIAPVATDPAGDAPSGTDITNLYSTVENGNVFFRIDTALNAPPVANAQSVVAVVGQALSITLTGSDYENSPLTYSTVTPPTQGVLSGTAPNLTYTPNSNAGTSDSFTFKVNDGALDSPTATVSIDIKRPPTITSVNTATFIPGQANSFTFTATGVPSPNFALSACNTALPPSISVTNNGNNTATLAGNPTVAQGGTYVCTLTASNGFGANSTQQFTLNLGLPPTFTSANSTSFTTGAAGSFTVTTTGTPATTSITQSGALPSGVTLSYTSGLTATLAGTPAAGTGGTYPITLTAGNGIPPNATQSFTLTVNQPPAVTSANSLTCTVGVACSLPITATGFPLPTIAVGGAALPGGISYVAGTPGNGTLSGTPAAGAVGTYAITFTASSSTAPNAVQNFTLTVNKASTTTALVSGLNPSIAGQSVTFTATVSPQGAGVPTGTVTFNDGATAVCRAVAVNGSGVATCTTSALTVAGSPHSMTAVYSGDASFTTSTSAALTQNVNKASSTTALSSSANPSVSGQAVTLTATIAAVAPGVGTPGGTVTFNDGATAVCSAVAVSAGVATCTTSSLSAAASPHSLTAVYSGDASFSGSTSSALSQVVGKASSTSTVASSKSPTVSGENVTFTATVAAVAPGVGTPSGTVTFNDGATAICTNVSLVAGSATCATAALGVASHSISVAYSGDAAFNASTSGAITQVVGQGGSATALTSSSNPSTAGSSVTFTATVSAVAPATGTPAGTVTFNDGATPLCSSVALAAGVATCTTSALGVGPHNITAVYGGSSSFGGSTSAGLTQNVNPGAATRFTITAPATATSGTAFNITVTALDALNNVATGYRGTVHFTSTDGAGTLPVDYTFTAGDSGAHTFASGVTLRTAGSRTITATDTASASVNGTSASITVGAAAATRLSVSAPATAVSGTPISFTVTALDAFNNTATSYSGTVHFTSTDALAVLPADSTLTSGVGTFSVTLKRAGVQTMTAVDTVTAAINGTSGNITVTPGAATSFTVTAPGTANSNSAINVTVTARDAASNIATGYSGTARFTSSDGSAVLPGNYAFVAGDNGAHIFSVTLVAGGNQTVTATDTVSASITGTSGNINVSAGPVVTQNPTDQTLNAGQTATFTAAATGTPTPTVQWQFSTDGGATFQNVAGATSTTLTVPNVAAGQNGTKFRAVFTNASGTATTTAATMTVNSAPSVTTSPVSQTISAGSNVTFTAAATGNPTPTVQWQQSTDGGATFTNIAGATSTTLAFTTTAGQNGNQYRAVFTNSVGSATSTAATLTVMAGPAVTQNPTDQTLNAGQTATFTAAATGTPTPTVQWQFSTDGGATFQNVAGATSTTLTVPNVAAGQNGTKFRAVFTNASGTATTTAATMTVNSAPSVTTSPVSQTISAGSNVTFTAAATGNPTPTVQWQQSTDGGATFTNIAGATSTTLAFTTTAGQNGNQYRAVFTNSVGSATSTAATLTIQVPPSVTTNPGNVSVNAGQTATFTAGASGSPTPTVQWQVSTNGGASFTNLAGATSVSLSFATTGTQNNNQYRAVFTNAAGSATTTAATLSVNNLPVATADTYSYVANTTLEIAAVSAVTTPKIYSTGSVRNNDSDAETATGSLVVGAGSVTSTNGGSCVFTANGEVTYTPPAGSTANDSCTYTLTDGQATVNGTVNFLHYTGPKVWYVKNNAAAGGDGRSHLPFNTLAAAQAASAAGDTIYVHNGDGTTTGHTAGITLKASQSLIGEGVALQLSGANAVGALNTFANPTLRAAGTKAALSNGGGTAISLSTGNTVRGVAVTSALTAMSGSNFGTLNLDTVDINNAIGNGVSLTNGTVNAVFDSLGAGSTSAATTGVNLSGVAGSFTANGALSLSTSTGTAVSVAGSSVALSLASAINVNGGKALAYVTNSGSVALTGAITATSGANAAFLASGGGTVTASNAANTLATTTGTALTVDGSTIGAAGLVFKSINTGAGAANGIFLRNTGTTAGLTVNGDGANTAVGGNASGGTIGGSSGADLATAGNGVYLENAKNVVLRRMTINGTHQNHGIRGLGVDGFTLEYSTVGGTMGTLGLGAVAESTGEGAIYFGNSTTNGIKTAATFTNNNISGGSSRNLSITNTTGTTALTLKGNTFGLNQNTTTADRSLSVLAINAGTTINSVVGGSAAGEANTFTGARGDIVNFTGQASTTMDVQFKNNALSNSHLQNNVGGGGVTFSTAGAMTFVADSNTMRDASGAAITFQKANSGTSFRGTFNNNTIGVAAVANSGSKDAGNGIMTAFGGAGTVVLNITNNQIHQISGNAHIWLDNTGGTYNVDTTITGNTLTTPGAGWFAGIAVTNGSPAGGETTNVCAKIGGSTAGEKNTLSLGGQLGIIVGSSGAGGGHVFGLPTYAGGANLVNVQNFLASNNAGSFTTNAYADAPATASAFTNTGPCATP